MDGQGKGFRAPFRQTLPQLFQAHRFQQWGTKGNGARRKVPTGALLLLLLLLMSLDRVSNFTRVARFHRNVDPGFGFL